MAGINQAGEREIKILSITFWGAVLNVSLVVIKISVGLLIRSYALLADGVHSLSDLATDFVVLVGARISNKPADATHPYGHRRFETISSLLIGTALLAVGFGFIWSASEMIFHHKTSYPGVAVLIVAVISVVSKEKLFALTIKVSRITASTSLYANAWHHRSDAFSSIAVLIGGIAGLFGWGHADHMAAIVVGVMIVGVAGKILYEGLIELSEHAADGESIKTIERVISEQKGVASFHALRTRKLGGELFLDVHVLVNPKISVAESHQISIEIENKIKGKLLRPVNILVHIEPAANPDH